MEIPRRFERPYRVRFDEAGADGAMRPAACLRFIQDLAWLHSEAAGFDREWYAARGMWWLVRGVELSLTGRADYGDTLAVTTEIMGWRRMWARRRSTVCGQDGASVATAFIDWVLLDDAGRPARIPTEMEALAASAARFTPTRVDLAVPPPDAARLQLAARHSDVDPMGHLNNAAYLDLLDEAAVQVRGQQLQAPATIRLEYLQPARAGMALESIAWSTGPGLAWRLRELGSSVDLLRATIV